MPKARLDRVIDRFQSILTDCADTEYRQKFTRYTVTNFRGGIGKSTLAFNLSWEISRRDSVLLLDMCSQRNFSQNLLGEDIIEQDATIYDALLAQVAGTEAKSIDDLLVSVKPLCTSFKGGQDAFLIPGSSELFLFPSILYGQLATYAQLRERGKEPSSRVLKAVANIVDVAMDRRKFSKVIIDTSPFFGGATHLAWEAAEALVIPVRVDQHSVDALKLTLSMLKDRKMDFIRFNEQAGIDHAPKVHAIAVTHCGWNRQKANTPDNSTKYFVEQVTDIVNEYAKFFTHDDLSECIYLLDDFHSSGRISGTKRIPLSKLHAGDQHTVEGRRLEVNPAVDRYKKEIKALASIF